MTINEKIEFLEKQIAHLVNQQEAIHENQALHVTNKSNTRWNAINIILGIILTAIPITLSAYIYLYSKTDNTLSKVEGFTETTGLLVDATTEFQRYNLDFDRGKYEMVNADVEKLISKLEQALTKQGKSGVYNKNLSKLLFSAYNWKAICLQYMDPIKNSNALEIYQMGKKMIAIDSNNWKGWQITAIGAFEQGYDYKIAAWDFQKSIERSTSYNPNGINLVETYFINNDFVNALKWANHFEKYQFKGDISKYRSQDGRSAFYIYRYVSDYIITGSDSLLLMAENRIGNMPGARKAVFFWEPLKNWYFNLDKNQNISKVRKERIKSFLKKHLNIDQSTK